MKAPESVGRITRIAGPVVGAVNLDGARVYDVVHVGHEGLIGEIIRLDGRLTTIQVYENTTGLRLGEPVRTTGAPLVATLGPGLLGQVYDGLQRPLAPRDDAFLPRGAASALDAARTWSFTPAVAVGDAVAPHALLGTVLETAHLAHRIMMPAGLSGTVTAVHAGPATVDDPVVTVTDAAGTLHPITMRRRRPVRRARRQSNPLPLNRPLITGTRIIDTLFPIARGGTGIIPGGFGTGKTVTEQSLARWAEVDVVVYIGCGERGNEMAEVLAEFPELEDPRYGAPLMQRTVLIANTSNMPVAAREASIYTGATIAEYYRDMGYAVLLLADSTSRWGEALREVSSRLEEMPGEEGYPAYLASRLAGFYERAGRLQPGPAGDEPALPEGSLTMIGAVSPPGGDFSEPMTQGSLRVVGTFWALDYDLSRRRHFPAINWMNSYTLYPTDAWFSEHVAADWPALRQTLRSILQQESDLIDIVQLVGPDALADEQRLLLAVAQMVREDYLQQNANDPVDRYCPLTKAEAMLRVILHFQTAAEAALDAGAPLDAITSLPIVARIARMKTVAANDIAAEAAALTAAIDDAFAALEAAA